MTYTIHETKERTAQTSLNTESDFTCSGRASSSWSTSRRVTLVTNTMLYREWVNEGIVLSTNGTYQWSFVTHIFRNG